MEIKLRSITEMRLIDRRQDGVSHAEEAAASSRLVRHLMMTSGHVAWRPLEDKGKDRERSQTQPIETQKTIREVTLPETILVGTWQIGWQREE